MRQVDSVLLYSATLSCVVGCSRSIDAANVCDMPVESEMGQRDLIFLKVMVRFCLDLEMGMSLCIVIAR